MFTESKVIGYTAEIDPVTCSPFMVDGQHGIVPLAAHHFTLNLIVITVFFIKVIQSGHPVLGEVIG